MFDDAELSAPKPVAVFDNEKLGIELPPRIPPDVPIEELAVAAGVTGSLPGIVGNFSIILAPKLDEGLNGFTELPPNPVG